MGRCVRAILWACFLTTTTVYPGECEEPEPKALKRFDFVERHMGTKFQITLYTVDLKTAQKASKAAFARIAELNGIMSDYDKTSELMQLCKKAVDKPVKVSRDLFRVLAHARKLSEKTNGAFDVTVGSITRLWRISRKRFSLPDPKRLKEELKRVGYRKIKLDQKHQTVELTQSGMRLDLGGIAKGYAADEALSVLRKMKITRALVAAGGDIAVGDAPPDRAAWKIGIAPLSNPNREPRYYLNLKNAAVSTSGDAEQYVEIDGRRYSHIVDPRTGIGVLGQFSVTVIAPKAMDTDSLATTIAVLGPKQGLKLIDGHRDRAMLFIRKMKDQKQEIRSGSFAKHLAE